LPTTVPSIAAEISVIAAAARAQPLIDSREPPSAVPATPSDSTATRIGAFVGASPEFDGAAGVSPSRLILKPRAAPISR
jgi:hypothetical protein